MRDILDNLTLEEKIRLFNGDGNWKTFGANGKIPVFVMSDGPHGVRKQDKQNYSDINNSKKATCFPTASCIASSWNKNALEKMGEAISREAISSGVDIILGCGMNIKRSPLCGRNFEYFSEDPFLTGKLAASYVKGVQKNGVGACIKHFACNNSETNRQVSNSVVDKRTLHEIYLKGFEIAVKESDPQAVMESYNLVNGERVCNSKYLLKDVLRNKWGFKGVVMSDWGACSDPAECINAGMDLAMPDSKGYFDRQIKKALDEGTLQESVLEESNARIIELAQKMKENKFFHHPEPDMAEQHKIALELAQESAVLLKNEGMLPLKAKERVIVIGELASKMIFQGGGSSHIHCEKYPSALECLKSAGFKVQYASCSNKKQITKLARLAFCKNIPVLFFTGLKDEEGEGFDRKTMSLPQKQLEILDILIKTGCKIGVINFSGAPVLMPFENKVAAILQMYLCGEGCGQAVADLVLGNVCPSGKLAETFPLTDVSIPSYVSHSDDDANIIEWIDIFKNNKQYLEGTFVGYRYYDSFNKPVLFNFGHGLSYTTFEYSDFKVKKEVQNGQIKVKVSFYIKNTGWYDGAEVVQVYVENSQGHNAEGKNLRAKKELRGFEKVFLKKHEQEPVEIELDSSAFSVYSEKEEKFVLCGGTYTIHAGASLTDIKFSTQIEIEGPDLTEIVPAENVSRFGVPKSPAEWYVTSHVQGEYTVLDNLSTLSRSSFIVKAFLNVCTFFIRLMNFNKKKNDPALRIAVCAISENPLESLISTSGGIVNEKLALWLVKLANSRKRKVKKQGLNN